MKEIEGKIVETLACYMHSVKVNTDNYKCICGFDFGSDEGYLAYLEAIDKW